MYFNTSDESLKIETKPQNGVRYKSKQSTMKNYSMIAGDLMNSMLIDIMPILVVGPFEKEVNYKNCRVELLNNDFGTIWVKWDKFDCEFKNLPLTAMATITDNIIK